MSFLTDDERRFCSAVSSLAFGSPFLCSRIECEQAALGDAFVPHGAVWNICHEASGPSSNVVALAKRVAELAEDVCSRLRDGATPTGPERDLYHDLVAYHLYYLHEPAFLQLVLTGLDPATERLECPQFFQVFQADFTHFLAPAGLDRGGEADSCAHLFACFHQIRRAFHHIFGSIVGGSMATAQLRAAIWQSIFTHDARRYRRHLYKCMGDFSVLITGASGTGKEIVAKSIALSRYIPFDARTGQFATVPVRQFLGLSLSALSPALVESELFGHRRGAFTGATEDRCGWLEACGPQGVVFLDEIGEISPDLQVKLLRVLETRSFQRLGELEERRFTGKLIAATNRDLACEIAEGRFRQDLYYRLCSDIIRTPSLSEQLAESPDEIQLLTMFLALRMVGEVEAEQLATETMRWIQGNIPADYKWPGNVRELDQCVRNVLIRGGYQPLECAPADQGGVDGLLERVRAGALTADELVQAYITLVYSRTGNYVETAKQLGLDRRTIKAKIDAEFLAQLQK